MSDVSRTCKFLDPKGKGKKHLTSVVRKAGKDQWEGVQTHMARARM